MAAVTKPAATITTQAAFEAPDLALWMWTKPWIDELDKYSSIIGTVVGSSVLSMRPGSGLTGELSVLKRPPIIEVDGNYIWFANSLHVCNIKSDCVSL